MAEAGQRGDAASDERGDLTDDYRQHLLDLCENTDCGDHFAAWKLAIEAKAAIPLLVAELRRYETAYNAVSEQHETILNQLGATDA